MVRRICMLMACGVILAACNLPNSGQTVDLDHAVELTLEAELTAQALLQPTEIPPTVTADAASQTPVPATATATANPYQVSARVDANCRSGPRTLYPISHVLPRGQQAAAISRNNDPNNRWLEVELAARATCWMSDITLNFDFNPLDLPVGEIPPTPEFTPGSIVGTVWHDLCDSSSPDPAFCQEVDGGEYQANGLLDLGEMTIVGVQVHLGAGDCPSIGLRTEETGPDASGGYEFDDLVPGKYCVTVDANEDGNDDILQAGVWTWPEGFESDVARRTVTVESGQTTPAVTFGWDYENLP
ncbi:MAG: SdrD B-like domain-containing protein [Anaerolineales bacterium]